MSNNPIVGHKTMADGTHLPIRKDEADAIMADIERIHAERTCRMPDERSAIDAMFDAWIRLQDFGWREAPYCPKDGSVFDVIEPGSTGIHPCSYAGEWPSGHFMVGSGDDYGPGRPILFKLRPEDQAKYDAKMAEMRARYMKDGVP